jgi:hypothetical protein
LKSPNFGRPNLCRNITDMTCFRQYDICLIMKGSVYVQQCTHYKNCFSQLLIFVYIATDLALIIVHKYPDLAVIPNKHGYSPLKLLATRPSAFRSGSKMIWWKRILYHCKCFLLHSLIFPTCNQVIIKSNLNIYLSTIIL